MMFEYAPAPSPASVVDIKPVVRAVHRRRVRRRRRRRRLQVGQPRHRGGARRGRRGRRRRRRPRRQGRPQGVREGLGPMPGRDAGQVPVPDRPDHPGALPRAGRAGVARQRQADQGVPRRRPAAGRRALLLLRRLGRQARARRLRRRPAAARRGRPGHPVELPAADAGLEDRPGAGRRQHGGAQAGRDHPADRAALRRDLPAGRPAAGRGQHRHRRRRHRPGAGRAPGRGQGRLHRLHRGRPGDRPRGRRHRKKLTLELGGKAANIVFDDAPIDQAVEGIVNGIFFNQGHVCCAGSRLLVQESVADEVLESLKRRMAHAAGRRPAGQEHRHRRDQLGRAAGPDPRAVRRSARPRAPSAGRRRASCPTAASGSRRRSSPASPRRTGSPARRSSARCCRC